MSLINQMLRDLEQRKPVKINSEQELKVKTSPDRRSGGLKWLWLLPLAALPIYIALDNPVKKNDQPITQPNNPAGTLEPTPAPITAIEPKPAEPEPMPVQPASPPIDTPPATVNEMPLGKPENPKPITKPAAKPLVVKIDKKPSAPRPEKVETLYQQAKTSASNMMAKQILHEALEIDPFYLPARTLLLQTLLKSHAPVPEITGFTENSLRLFPDNPLFIKTRAHLYIQQKDFAAAVDLLEKIEAESLEDSHYLSLLAATYQQLQRFSQSARIYERLTRMQPDKAEYWLGLAVAEDKLNHAGPAAQAYRLALDKKTLNSEVVDYIKQRLSHLN